MSLSYIARRVVRAVRWRFFDRFCPYKFSVCWDMSRDADPS